MKLWALASASGIAALAKLRDLIESAGRRHLDFIPRQTQRESGHRLAGVAVLHIRWIVSAALASFAVPGLAQVMPDPSTSMDAGSTIQTDNAGRSEASTQSSGSSHEESSTQSSGGSVSFGGGIAPPPSFPPPRPAYDAVAAVAGRWKLSLPDGSSSCTAELKPSRAGDQYDLYIVTGCPDGFFTASKWRPIRNGVEITELFGKALGSFRQVGRNRMEGTRASDGAAVILTR